MSVRDNNTYGLNKRDAEEVVQLIASREQTYREGIVRGGGGGGLRLYRFTLNENMGATTANKGDADILEMDGTDTGTDADVEDPEAVFSTLLNNDTGLCLLQDGAYYIIQAPCP